MTRRPAYVALALIPLLLTAPAPDESLTDRLHKGLQRFVDSRDVSGLVALVGDKDGDLACVVLGQRDLASAAPMERGTLFRVMSITKPITSIAVMMLVDENKIRLDDPIERYLPEFRGQKLYLGFEGDKPRLGPVPRLVTVRDLLTHTSGVPDTPPPGYTDLDKHPDFTLAEAVKVIAGRPLGFPPGSKWSYSNAGMWTLGRLVEVASGKSYQDFLADRLFTPLGMTDTTFYPTPEQMKRAAVVYDRKGGKLVEVPSSRVAPIAGKDRPSPAGGLFSTADDLAKVYRMMLHRGELEAKRYLTEASVAEMTRLQTGDLKCGFVNGMGFGLGFGFVKVPEGVTASLSPGTFGHGGAYGTQGWVDAKRDRFVVLMIQRVGLRNADDTPMRGELQRIGLGGQNGLK